MNRKGKKIGVFVLASMAVLTLLIIGSTPVGANDAANAQGIVDKAKVTFDAFMRSKDYSWIHENLKNARGILIYPQILKAGFILGGSGGSVFSWPKTRRAEIGASLPSTQWVPSASVFRSAAKRRRP